MSKTKPNLKSFVLGAIIGAAVGTCATLLYMPQTGGKLRREIKKKGKKLKKGLEDLIKQSQGLAGNWKENFEKISQVVMNAEETAEENKAISKSKEKKPSPKTSSSPRIRKKVRFFKGI